MFEAKIGDKIIFLKPVGFTKAGSIGEVTGDCGCASNPKWIVRMRPGDKFSDIQIAKRNNPRIARYRVLSPQQAAELEQMSLEARLAYWGGIVQ